MRGATDVLSVKIGHGSGNEKFSLYRHVVAKPFEELVDELTKIPVSRLLRIRIERLWERLETDGSLTLSQAEVLLKEIQNDIVIDLTSPWFLMIPSEKRALYEQDTPVFGQQVADCFPCANYDIQAAGRCFALDEWTACVFHMMRVLEIGLRHLGTSVGLPEAALAFENWKVIIDQIEKRVKEFAEAPKSKTKSDKLQFYSEAAASFRHFRDAWRNHVSHSRATYDEREASIIWDHVQTFMQVLAKQDSEHNA